MKSTLVTNYVCLDCRTWRKVPTPELVFESKVFQVAGNDLYIDGFKIDDYMMSCHTIFRAKENGSLLLNNINYEVNNNILFINKEKIGDYKLAVEAIKRARELSQELSPKRCEKKTCGREGPFIVSSEFLP